jgi:hypothetical protein
MGRFTRIFFAPQILKCMVAFLMKLMKNFNVRIGYPHITCLPCRLQILVGANVFFVINFKNKSSFLKGGSKSVPDN